MKWKMQKENVNEYIKRNAISSLVAIQAKQNHSHEKGDF